jgi:hypothetical protein
LRELIGVNSHRVTPGQSFMRCSRFSMRSET